MTIHVLEFKRTSDFFPDSFERGFLRKFIKYQPLVEALMLSNPDWSVNLLVFTLGDRGLLDEERWLENWATLALPDKGFSTFAVTAATLAQTPLGSQVTLNTPGYLSQYLKFNLHCPKLFLV